MPHSSSNAANRLHSSSLFLMRGTVSWEGETPSGAASWHSSSRFGVLAPDSYCAIRTSALLSGKPTATPSAFCVMPRSIR